MPYSLVIFDLDGTLSDSLPWFMGHVNDVADRFRFRRVVLPRTHADDEPVLSELGEELRRAGTREILKRLEVPRWKVPFIARHMRRLKSTHMASIPLFAGVDRMLRTLHSSGLKLALVSSDTEKNARRQLGPANAALFTVLACGASLNGKAAKFQRVLKRTGVAPYRALAIGDEVRDIEAARSVGMACGAVTWGYAAPETLRALKPDLVFERMEEIAERLVAAKAQT